MSTHPPRIETGQAARSATRKARMPQRWDGIGSALRAAWTPEEDRTQRELEALLARLD